MSRSEVDEADITARQTERIYLAPEQQSAEETKPAGHTMLNTMSQSVKTADRLVEDSVTETIVEISFESEFLCLLHCSSIAVGWVEHHPMD